MDALHRPARGYNLTGLPENRCPECGNRFSAEGLGSPRSPHGLAVILVVVFVPAGVPAGFAAAWAGATCIDVTGNVHRSALPGFFILAMQIAFVASGSVWAVFWSSSCVRRAEPGRLVW